MKKQPGMKTGYTLNAQVAVNAARALLDMFG